MRRHTQQWSRTLRPSLAWALCVMVLLPLPSACAARAETDAADARALPAWQEPHASGWSFYVDNDFLSAGLSNDQGYTGGFALGLAGRRAVEYPWSLDPVLGFVDGVSGWSTVYDEQAPRMRHWWEIGTMAFTPEETGAREPTPGDRPYAGVVYIGNTRQVYRPKERVGYLSGINVGVLGSAVPQAIQYGLHELVDDKKPNGWDNQISDGGEFTFLWEVQRTETHWSVRSGDGFDAELNSVVDASVGYITQARAGVTARWGKIASPPWAFNPDYGEYINTGAPGGWRGGSEIYLWGGMHVARRFYNAFLEGQFRDSPVTYDRAELNSSLWAANIGATWALSNGYHVTLALRARERELETAMGQRPAWGSLIIGRRF